MTRLRRFEEADAEALKELQSADMPVEAVRSMIRQWNTLVFQGRTFEMFAILRDGELVGQISLYQHSDGVVSIGPEVFQPFRRQGIAKSAMLSAMEIAKGRGFKIVCQQVRSDNLPSIALHKSLGFETDSYGYLNKKGREVFIFLKAL